MAFVTLCTHCGTSHKIEDRLEGKRIRCKECEEPFTAMHEDDRPRRRREQGVQSRRSSPDVRTSSRRRDTGFGPGSSRRSRGRDRNDFDDDYDDEYKEKSGLSTGAIVGISVGGGTLLVGIIVAVILMSSSSDDESKGQAKGPPQNIPRVRVPNRRPVMPPVRVPANPKDAPIVWNVQPDPIKAGQLPKINGDVGKIAYSGTGLTFPSSYPAVVAVPTNARGVFEREIWSLTTQKQIGKVQDRTSYQNLALSPDGKYLALHSISSNPPAVRVYPTDGPNVHQVVVDEKSYRPKFIDFVNERQIVTVKWIAVQGFSGTVVQVWDFVSGNKQHEIRRRFNFRDLRSTQLSPGRRYLATLYTERLKWNLILFDLHQGKAVGELKVPVNERNFFSPTGVSFSPDGKLVSVMGSQGRDYTIFSWDLSQRGKLVHQHTIARNISVLTPRGLYATQFAWLPDGSGWIVRGQLLIEADSGNIVYQIPLKDDSLAYPLRLIDNSHLVLRSSKGGQRFLTIQKLSKENVDAAVNDAKGGNNAEGLVRDLSGDWSTVKTLPAPSGNVAWNVTPDSAESKQPISTTSLTLGIKSSDILQTLMTGPEVGHAIVLSHDSNDRANVNKSITATRFDLRTGKKVSEGNIGKVQVLRNQRPNLHATVSVDGKWVAYVTGQDQSEVQFWSLDNFAKVKNWQPYSKETDKKVTWLGIADDKHLLTMGKVGKLTCWEFAKQKAIYTSPTHQRLAALSPTGKYVVAYNGSGFDVLESTTGDRKGQLEVPADWTVSEFAGVGAFLRDGTRFAVTTTGWQRPMLWYDFETGKLGGKIGNSTPARTLIWFNKEYVQMDGQLVDLKLGWPLLSYALGMAPQDTPDGRLWFVHSNLVRAPAQLRALEIPNANVKQFRGLVEKGAVKPLLSSGMTVSIQVQGLPDAKLTQRTVESFESRFNDRGIKTINGNADLRFIVAFSIKNTGRQLSYRTLTGGNRGTTRFPEQEVQWQVNLVSGAGDRLWSNASSTRTSAPTIISNVADVRAHLEKSLWNRAASSAGMMTTFPDMIVRGPTGIINLPQQANLAR